MTPLRQLPRWKALPSNIVSPRRPALRGALLSALGYATACSSQSDPTETIRQEISGGSEIAACSWASVGVLAPVACTGTLIHPKLILTAAHCGENHKTFSLGPSRKLPARTVDIAWCKLHEQWDPDPGKRTWDFAVCELKEAVDDIPIVPIASGCESDFVTPGLAIVAVGFGSQGLSGGCTVGPSPGPGSLPKAQ